MSEGENAWADVPGSMMDEGLGQTPGRDWLPDGSAGDPTGKDWLPDGMTGAGGSLPLPFHGLDNDGTGKDWLPGGGASSTSPHGGSGLSVPRQLAIETAWVIAWAAANAPHEVNSGLWGVPGYGWSNVWPVDPRRVKVFKVADPYSRIPKSLPIGGGGGRVGSSGRGYLGPHADGLYYLPGELPPAAEDPIAESYRQPSVPYDPNDSYYQNYYSPGEAQHTDIPRFVPREQGASDPNNFYPDGTVNHPSGTFLDVPEENDFRSNRFY